MFIFNAEMHFTAPLLPTRKKTRKIKTGTIKTSAISQFINILINIFNFTLH